MMHTHKHKTFCAHIHYGHHVRSEKFKCSIKNIEYQVGKAIPLRSNKMRHKFSIQESIGGSDAAIASSLHSMYFGFLRGFSFNGQKYDHSLLVLQFFFFFYNVRVYVMSQNLGLRRDYNYYTIIHSFLSVAYVIIAWMHISLLQGNVFNAIARTGTNDISTDKVNFFY